MKLPQLAAAIALSAALFTAGCEKGCCHREGCCPTAAAPPPCGCNGPAGPAAPAAISTYPPTVVTTPPPGATIIHQ